MSKSKHFLYTSLFIILLLFIILFYIIAFRISKNALTMNFLNYESLNVENVKKDYMENMDTSIFSKNSTTTSYYLLVKNYDVIFYGNDRENFPVYNYLASLGNYKNVYTLENYILNNVDGIVTFTDINKIFRGAIVRNFIINEENYTLVYVIDASIFYKDSFDSLFFVTLFVMLSMYVLFAWLMIVIPLSIRNKQKTVYIHDAPKEYVAETNNEGVSKVKYLKIYDKNFLLDIIDKVNNNDKYDNTYFLYFKIYGAGDDGEESGVELKTCRMFLETEIFNSFISMINNHAYIATFVNSSDEEVKRIKELYSKIFKDEFGDKYLLHIYEIDLNTLNYAIEKGDLNI